MNALVYKQMIGRAGRTGKDTVGESILICTEQNRKMGEELVKAQLANPVTSCLVNRGADGEAEYNMNHMKRALLEIMAAGVATTNEDLKMFVKSTLFYLEHSDLYEDLDFEEMARRQMAKQLVNEETEGVEKNAILECIKFLIEYEFIRTQVNEDQQQQQSQETTLHFFATRLGLACLSSSLPPVDGFLLFSELQRSRQCFVLESELHAIYLVTPYSVCNQLNDIDWLLFLDMWEKLPIALQRVGEIVGIRNSFICKAMRGFKKLDYKLIQIHKRFYIALALQELVNEMSVSQVAQKFKLNRGLLQSLQQMAGTFAGIVTSFCNSLNWTMMSLIVGQFKDRLYFGIHHDLIDLMRLPSLNSQRARALFNNGIQTLIDLARTNVFTVEKIMYDQVEFQSEKQREDEQEYEVAERKKMRNFFVTGKVGLTVKEGAELIIQEARVYLEQEMGIQNIDWNTQPCDISNNCRADSSVGVLKRHSTEELLDGMIVGKKVKNDNSFSTKFSSELNELERPPKIDQDVGSSSEDEAVEDDVDKAVADEEVINPSNVMDGDKFDNEVAGAFEEIKIIQICGDRELFAKFKAMLLNKKTFRLIGMAIGVTQIPREDRVKQEQLIGAKVVNRKRLENAKGKEEVAPSESQIDAERLLSGIALCLNGTTVCYMDMIKSEVVSWKEKVDFLHELLQLKGLKIAMIDVKEQLKALWQVVPKLTLGPEVTFEDPKVANWMLLALCSDNQMNSLPEMTKLYIPECSELVELLCHDESNELYATAMNGRDSPVPVHWRAGIESCLVLQLIISQRRRMEHLMPLQMIKTFQEIEMPVQVSLAFMEIHGIQINVEALNELTDRMKGMMDTLEQHIYQLHGRAFNLRSTKVLKSILGVSAKPKGATMKELLEQLETPLAQAIVQHRKLGGILAKMMYPIARTVQDGRIHCKNVCFTATGRINMQEPSIQTLAKDFEVEIPHEGTHTRSMHMEAFSIRSLFEPKSAAKRYFVAADFCQLELRILAHFCEDKTLLKIFKSNHDVFKAIAAKWHKINESKVTEQLRNDTKQICYGIIYGMGNKSLAVALKVDEATAEQRITDFHNTYPGIRQYIEATLLATAEAGYIETLNGRRRYFPLLAQQQSSESMENVAQVAMRKQQQRQAVNTKIQGSAADILKAAMLRVERNLKKNKATLNLKLFTEFLSTDMSTDASRVDMVLHLHDELMYEIPANRLKHFAKLLKSSMEGAVTLKVPLHVKLKAGPNWGQMKEYPL